MTLRETIAAILDSYDNGEGEPNPEDGWRVYRDIRRVLESEAAA